MSRHSGSVFWTGYWAFLGGKNPELSLYRHCELKDCLSISTDHLSWLILCCWLEITPRASKIRQSCVCFVQRSWEGLLGKSIPQTIQCGEAEIGVSPRWVLYTGMGSVAIPSPCTPTLHWYLDLYNVNVLGKQSTHCRAPEPQMLLNRFHVSLLRKFNKLKWP